MSQCACQNAAQINRIIIILNVAMCFGVSQANLSLFRDAVN